MANYTVNWEKKADQRIGWQYTASTMYEADGFRIWKGKYHVGYSLYSANEWHLERLADHKVIFSAKTAKECKEAMDWAVEKGVDLHDPAVWSLTTACLGY